MRCRKEPLEIDPAMYEWRHPIENFFAMRACKTDRSLAAMIDLTATTIDLR